MTIPEELKREVTAIVHKTHELEILTPLMLHGYHGKDKKGYAPKYAELREPSVKGVIRYWWRALQYEEEWKQIKKIETDLFGGAGTGEKEEGRRSRIQIKWLNPTRQSKEESVCPHKDKKFFTTAMEASRQKFHELQISCYRRDEDKLKEAEPYIRLTWMLSGLGQRARRGAGALQLRKVSGSNAKNVKWENALDFKVDLFQILRESGKEDVFTEGPTHFHLIQLRSDKLNLDNIGHPVLQNVWIGEGLNGPANVRNRISKAGHEANSGKGGKQFLGKAKGGREASPLHATVRRFGDHYYPVISEVRKIEKQNDQYLEARTKFLRCLGVNV